MYGLTVGAAKAKAFTAADRAGVPRIAGFGNLLTWRRIAQPSQDWQLVTISMPWGPVRERHGAVRGTATVPIPAAVAAWRQSAR